ncbi:MAG: hypothetical protein HON34_08305 [Pelagibacteraceae bacterium]|nr:hypothetical protein [Pelagibacteraceae bacterium]
MKYKFLVTTPLQETWPSKDCKIIFLGEWCKLFTNKNNYEEYDYETLDYHWDDRKKLEEDYNYLLEFYEKTIKDLAIKMNEIHEVNFSLRYWKILLGPWLSLLIHSVFDRWEMIQVAINVNKYIETNILIEDKIKWIAFDQTNFKKLVMEDDGWNNFIYSEIIEFNNDKVKINRLKIPEKKKKIIIKERNTKITFWRIYHFIAKLFSFKNNSFIISSYLNKIDETILSFRLFQLPLFINPNSTKIFLPQQKLRKWKIEKKTVSRFEKFILKIIPKQIPTIYLEGYQSLNHEVKVFNWKKNPKSIFTSNSIHNDEIFKHFVGANENSKLVIGQHGGSYGISKLHFLEYHELSITDKYISWGWVNKDFKSKIIPLGQITKRKKPKIKLNNSKLVIIMLCNSRYSYYLSSLSISSQWLNYFNDQVDLITKLNNDIKNNTIIRLYKKDYGWSSISRFKEIFNNLEYDEGEIGIEKHYPQTKLFIATYDSTSYLENFGLNLPTILFWDNSIFEMKDYVKPLFNELKKVKVYHESPESAAEFINENWENIDDWWNSNAVKNAIERFNNSVNKQNNNIINDLSKILSTCIT